jgi:hypothetical protein
MCDSVSRFHRFSHWLQARLRKESVELDDPHILVHSAAGDPGGFRPAPDDDLLTFGFPQNSTEIVLDSGDTRHGRPRTDGPCGPFRG